MSILIMKYYLMKGYSLVLLDTITDKKIYIKNLYSRTFAVYLYQPYCKYVYIVYTKLHVINTIFKNRQCYNIIIVVYGVCGFKRYY